MAIRIGKYKIHPLIISSAVILLVRWIFVWFPDLAETVYASGVFVAIRYVVDYTVGFIPFAIVYLVVLGLIGWVVLKIVKRERGLSFKDRMLRIWHLTWKALAVVFIWFMISWGFNYTRTPFEERIGLQEAEVDVDRLFEEATLLSDLSGRERAAIAEADTSPLTHAHLPEDLEDQVRELVAETLIENGFAAYGRPRCRHLGPGGFLRRMGIQGIYLPFTGEAHVDPSLPAAIMPFTMAHELAHSYGHTDEGTANFVAWLACSRSEEPIIKYSGTFVYFQYIRAEARDIDTLFYQQLVEQLPAGVAADRRDHITDASKYGTWFPTITDRVNDAYLKAQGVSEGSASYDRLVAMVLGWKDRPEEEK